MCDNTQKLIQRELQYKEFLRFDFVRKQIERFPKAKEQVNEYCPAKDEAKFPPKIVNDSVSKNNNPAAKPKCELILSS